MNKKKAFTMTAAVALVGAMGVGATLAYFTDTEDATNVVTMGNVNIKLEESDGTKITSDGLTFEDVLPGQTVTKEPMISLDGTSQDAYIRVKMDITMDDATEEQLGHLEDLEETLTQQIEWTTDNAKTRWLYNEADGYFYYNTKLVKTSDVEDEVTAVLFENVTIPTSWDNSMADTTFNIELTAEAIQADYLNEDVIVMDENGWNIASWNLGEDVKIQDYEKSEASESEASEQ